MYPLFFIDALIACGFRTQRNPQSDSATKTIAELEAEHLAWCERTYHQNTACPKHGEVVVPPEVLEQREAEHLAWCERTYHRNYRCPKHGQVYIPLEEIESDMADDLAWCESIEFAARSCVNYAD